MPGFDKTGPEGKGKLTGRGFGPCNENFVQGKEFDTSLKHCFGRGHKKKQSRGHCRNQKPEQEQITTKPVNGAE